MQGRVRLNVERVTDALRTEAVQRLITARTHRRPVVASVPPAAGPDTARRRELPFPGTRSVADGLLDARRPALLQEEAEPIAGALRETEARRRESHTRHPEDRSR